jgi:tetratricopeptide (TPR) repeat protein
MNVKPVLRRLRDHEPGPGPNGDAEARAGEIIRSVEQPRKLAAQAHTRILRRLRGEPAAAGEPARLVSRHASALQVASGVALVALGASAAVAWFRGAGSSGSETSSVNHAPPALTDAPAAPLDAPPAPTDAPPALTNAPPLPAMSSAGKASAANGPPRSAIGAPSAAAAASASASTPPSSLAEESRLLAIAFDQLRARHDFNGALATLRLYDARFPDGKLRSEALRTRLDALTGLGNWVAALDLLDHALDERALSPELRVLRGELRAGAGRCAEATQDLDRALTGSGPGRLAERALYARASCRAQLGDRAAATADLNEYLERFPDGPHAAEAKERLGR